MVTKGTIVVTVSDPQGSRLPGVVVTAQAPDSVTAREVATNSQGVATLRNVPPRPTWFKAPRANDAPVCPK